MLTQTWIRLAIMIVVTTWCRHELAAQTLHRYSFSEPHLGTIVELTIYAAEENAANEAAKAGFARIKELDLIFSDYKPESETMRLCETAGTGKSVKVSPELLHLIEQSLSISEKTDGAFDITVGPLITLWRRARKEKRLPTTEELHAAQKSVGWKNIVLNEDGSVELKQRGMRLDFGGIAKGYIAQKVSRCLADQGCNRTLVAVAGDIVANEPPPGAAAWKVGIARLRGDEQSPSRLVRLTNRAISTSGDAFQFVEIEGVRYSHIIDPKTGIGLTTPISATVIAPDGETADAYATAICIMGPERGLKLLEQLPDVQAMVVQSTHSGVQTFESPGFKNNEVN